MSIRKNLAVLLTAGTVVAFAFSAKPAQADLVPVLISHVPSVVNPGDTTFTYRVDLSSGSYVGGGSGTVTSGTIPNAGTAFTQTNFTTLYDIGGFVPLSEITLSNPDSLLAQFHEQNVGTTAYLTTPADDSGIINLTLGINDSDAKTTGPVLGIYVFSFDDSFSNVQDLDFYTGQTHKDSPLDASNTSIQGNIGSVSLPSLTPSTRTPEPASYAAFVMGGLGLLGLGLKARRRQNAA